MNTPTQIIRKTLKVCSDCKNCKLIIWDGKASKDLQKRIEVVNVSKDGNILLSYTLRCQWLKMAIIDPDKLVKCEGKQSFHTTD